MKTNEIVYNLVLYSRWVKKNISFLLKQPWLVKNSLYQYLYQKEIQKKTTLFSKQPFRVMIENTNVCNADCVFCPHLKMKRKTGVMKMNLFKKIIDDCADTGIGYVTIYGFGEPFLDRFFIERIKYAKNRGINRVTTNTNAAYMSKDKAEAIIDADLDEIYISFDASTKETYKKIRPNLDFETVEENIKTLVALKKKKLAVRPLIYLSFVETEINKSEVGLYKEKWQSLVDGISFSQVHNWTGEINFGHKENSVLKDPCRLLWTDMVISFDGRVPLCCNDYENRIILGNIEKQSIVEIWGGEKLRKVREKHLKRQFENIAICSFCQYNYHYKSPWWINK